MNHWTFRNIPLNCWNESVRLALICVTDLSLCQLNKMYIYIWKPTHGNRKAFAHLVAFLWLFDTGVFLCQCFFIPFRAFLSGSEHQQCSLIFQRQKLWPYFASWAVHARTILSQNLLCDSFQRGTAMPHYQVWTIELSNLTVAHSVSHEKISP